jgi:hypothetical protein
MARITVASDALERGQFPPVCCRTGVHTDNYVRWNFVETPTWTWILLPFGFLPFVIARFATSKTFSGVLPISPNVVRRVRRLSQAAVVLAALGVAAFVAALATTVPVAIAFVLLGLAVLAFVAELVGSPDARRDLRRGAVEIRNVHPTFVGTIEAAWAQQQRPEA